MKQINKKGGRKRPPLKTIVNLQFKPSLYPYTFFLFVRVP